jgi:hypothetical protein
MFLNAFRRVAMAPGQSTRFAPNQCSDFPWPLYSYRNPTFPTFAGEVVDYATLILVG